jgi:serine/threonine protein kinase
MEPTSSINSNIAKHRLRDGSLVVIKTIDNEDDMGLQHLPLRRCIFLQLMKGCSNILQLLNVDIKIDIDFNTIVELMMTYHTGDLRQIINEIPLIERLRCVSSIMNQTLNGLYQLNARGIIHHDIKPQNILVDYNYDNINMRLMVDPVCYISDFGLSDQLECNIIYRFAIDNTNVYSVVYCATDILVENPHNEMLISGL